MKTLTITKARQNLGQWIAHAVRGEDIGIIDSASGQIVALRPVEVVSEDYAFTEYGITREETKRAVRKLNRIAKREKTVKWDGTAKGLRG